MSHLNVFRNFWEPFLSMNALLNSEQEIIHYLCEDWIEKSVPCDQYLSSLGKPRDAKQDFSIALQS